MSRRHLILAVISAFALPVSLLAQNMTFEGTVVNTSAQGPQEFIMQYTDGDFDNMGRLFDTDVGQLMSSVRDAGGTVRETVLQVKGPMVRTDIPELQGYMIFDAESGNMTLVRSAQYYASFTAEELEQMFGGMMGGGAGGAAMPPGTPDAVRAMMGGGEPAEVTGPDAMNRSGDLAGVSCNWYEAAAGNIGMPEGQAMMQEGLRTQACVTKSLESAWSSYKSFMEAIASLPMMGGQKGAQALIQDSMAERGLPIITKSVKRAPGITPSWSFEVGTTEVKPGSIDGAVFSEHEGLEQLQLQEFMMRMMGGR